MGPLQTPSDCLESTDTVQLASPPQGWFCVESFDADPVQFRLFTDGNGQFGVAYAVRDLPEGTTRVGFHIRSGGHEDMAPIVVAPSGFVRFQGTYGDRGWWGATDWFHFRTSGSPELFTTPNLAMRATEFEGDIWYLWVFSDGGPEHYMSRMMDFNGNWLPAHYSLTGEGWYVSLDHRALKGTAGGDYYVQTFDWLTPPCSAP